ncbi:MAG: hypothetical protein ACSLE2_16260, partial [Lysobacterales bacterium]
MKICQVIVIPLSLFLLAACGGREEPGVERPVEAPVAAADPADLLLLNGYVYTVDEARSVAQAVAVKDGLI